MVSPSERSRHPEWRSRNTERQHADRIGSPWAVFDLVSFRQSAGEMIHRALRYHRDLLEESRVTSDPALRAVFVEDTVSLSGDVITSNAATTS